MADKFLVPIYLPRWLHEPDLRRDVLAIAPARPQHGGSGALYLLLRKPL